MIGQRLVNMQDTEGRALASEIMFNTPFISDLIAKGQVGEIKGVMKKGRAQGMQTFDQSLFELFETSVISYSEALRYADSVNDLRLLIKTESNRAKSADFTEGTEKLEIL
jgi:twitching motility protein PilU